VSKTPTQIKSLARAHTERAIQVLQGIMDQPSASEAARVSAANSLLDRGWGKPAQAIVGGDEDDPDLKIIHEIRRTIVNPGDTNGGGVPPTP
jgi:hypothetical protein